MREPVRERTTSTAAAAEDLGDFTTTPRVLAISALAVFIGVVAAFVAAALLRLIGLFTNLFFFQRFGTTLVSPAGRRRLDRAPQAAQEQLVASVDALPGAERARLAATLEGLVRGMALPRKRPAMFFEEPARRMRVRRRARA